jgi:Domain of unknown function (DUF4124)
MRAAAVLLAGLFAAAATAQNAYRFVMPDGRVVYSDQPVPGARLDGTIVTPPAPSSPVPVTTLTPREEALARDADERLRRLNELTEQIQAASRDLAAANAALQAGLEPREGERIGTYAGRARLNDAYWARQETNQRAVAIAQARLDRAVQERNGLR